MVFMVRIVLCLCVSIFGGCNISLPEKKQHEYIKEVPHIEHPLKKNSPHNSLSFSGTWPAKQWWQAYKSSELNTLITESLINNPNIQEVQRHIMVAKQEAIVSGSLLFPLIFFNASDVQQHLSKNGLYRALNPNLPLNPTLVDLTLSFNYEFDFWGQNRNLFREALGKAKVQEAEAAQVELITTTALSQVYFAYKTNLIRKQLYEELVAVRSQTINLQNLLQHQGLSSQLPVLAAAANVQEAKQLLTGIREELANNQHVINVLAGRAPNTPLRLNGKLPALVPALDMPKTISLDLVARRPDLMAQIWRAKAWAYKTGAAMSAYYPNVNIMGFIGLESVAWQKLFAHASSMGGIKPAINLPIFTAGAIRANIHAAKAEFDAAIFAYNNLLLHSTQEILDVLVFAQTVYQRQKEQHEIVRYAQQRYRLVQLRQQQGLDSQFAVYALQEELIQARLAQVNLLYNQYLASIKLTKALGGGYHQTEIPLVKKYEKEN